MNEIISLENLKQSLETKGYKGDSSVIESTYKTLSLPFEHHYLGASELESLTVKIEIAGQMGYLPVGDMQIQIRSSIKNTSSEFYKHFFVQAVQKTST